MLNSNDIALMDAFKKEFGPGADRGLVNGLFGPQSPLAGRFNCTAHPHLLVFAMNKGLGGNPLQRLRELRRFFREANARRAGEGSGTEPRRPVTREEVLRVVEETLEIIRAPLPKPEN